MTKDRQNTCDIDKEPTFYSVLVGFSLRNRGYLALNGMLEKIESCGLIGLIVVFFGF